jgi:hypothetical protein
MSEMGMAISIFGYHGIQKVQISDTKASKLLMDFC